MPGVHTGLTFSPEVAANIFVVIVRMLNRGFIVWRYFYDADGLLNLALNALHLSSLTHYWLGDPNTALGALIFMRFPWVDDFGLLIFFAGLQGISSEVLEAAHLDGATGFRRVWTMDIPLILPQSKLLLILATINNVQNIVIPLVMTNGGPGVSTDVPALEMYNQAITYGQFGYSMAISFVLFVVVLILPYIASGQALSIFVLRTFFQGISYELVEAAKIDGAGDLRVYRSLVMPLSVPVLVSVGIVNLAPLWNDYLLPWLLLDSEHQTLTMALVFFQGNAITHSSSQFGPLMASYALAAVPLAILFGFLMRYYVERLTSGALKL